MANLLQYYTGLWRCAPCRRGAVGLEIGGVGVLDSAALILSSIVGDFSFRKSGFGFRKWVQVSVDVILVILSI